MVNPRSVRPITETEEETSKGTNPRADALPKEEKVETPAPEFTGRPIRLAEIQANEYLMKNGILAGDLWDEESGEITRVFSKPEDAMTEGHVITQEEINVNPYLQENDIRAGDRFYDGVIHRANTDNTWMQFKYGIHELASDVENAGIWLESRIPIGEINIDLDINDFSAVSYDSPEELYGKGFATASPEERREMIIARKERQMQHDFGQFFDPDEDSKARMLGNVTGVLATPTTAIPFFGGYKTQALLGATIAGGSTALDQFVQEGEVDPASVALASTIGAVLPPTIMKGVNVVKDKGATKVLTQAQAVIDKHMAQGGSTRAINEALTEAKINPIKVEMAAKRLGTKVRIPLDKTQAEKAINKAITRDSAVSRQYSKGLDKFLGTISTRIGNISQSVKNRLREFEFDTHARTAEFSKRVEPFFTTFKDVPKATQAQISKHLFNGDFDAATGLMSEFSPALSEAFEKNVKPVLDELGTELLESGHSFEKIANYFPRRVKDYDALRASLGLKERGILDEQLEAYAKNKKTSVSKLTDEERSKVIDLALRGYKQTKDGFKPSFAKQRAIDKVDNVTLDTYANADESLAMYIRNAVHDVERRKFFGRSTKVDDANQFDTQTSIGQLVKDELADGTLDKARQLELEELLSARFIGGEQSPSAVGKAIRDLGYMGTIANPITAMIQLSDAGVTSGLSGFRNTIASMFGTKEIKIVDLGIDDLITKELALGDNRKIAKALDKIMSGVGFKAIDRLSKETLINAALKRARAAVKSPKGEAKLRKEVEKVMGKETDAFIADMKAGEVSRNVKLWAFNELSDVQPVSLSEMPEMYLNSKNGRLAYMLKSFTLKQIDLVRNKVIGQWKAGNKVQASKNAALLAGYLTTSNVATGAVKDILLGREVRVEDIPDRAIWSLLGVYGMNEYVYDRYLKQGKIIEGGMAYITPAAPYVEALTTLATEPFEDDPDYSRALTGIPAVGRLLYNWYGGGAEKFNERLDEDE
jgi:hypothetical protein